MLPQRQSAQLKMPERRWKRIVAMASRGNMKQIHTHTHSPNKRETNLALQPERAYVRAEGISFHSVRYAACNGCTLQKAIAVTDRFRCNASRTKAAASGAGSQSVRPWKRPSNRMESKKNTLPTNENGSMEKMRSLECAAEMCATGNVKNYVGNACAHMYVVRIPCSC